MIETQYCSPAPARKNKTPSHLKPQGKDVKAAAFDSYRKEGNISKTQKTVMGVLWRINFPLTRKQIVANCPNDHQVSLSSVCGRVNELIGKGYIDCNETVFDKDTRKHVQALQLSESGINAYKAMQDIERSKDSAHKPSAKQKTRQHTYAKRAGILCQDYDFCCFVYERDRNFFEKMNRSHNVEECLAFLNMPTVDKIHKGRHLVDEFDSNHAAGWLRAQCCVGSRSELDNDSYAQDLFEEVVWDFAQWVSKRGRPAPVLQLMGAQ